MPTRECPYCGKRVDDRLSSCIYCRETFPESRRPLSDQTQPDPDAARQGTRRIRYGLLFMLLAALIGYFASGASPMKVPVFVPPAVMKYFVPLLFMSGLALGLYGFYQRHLASS